MDREGILVGPLVPEEEAKDLRRQAILEERVIHRYRRWGSRKGAHDNRQVVNRQAIDSPRYFRHCGHAT
jgi:hypothetical protein